MAKFIEVTTSYGNEKISINTAHITSYRPSSDPDKRVNAWITYGNESHEVRNTYEEIKEMMEEKKLSRYESEMGEMQYQAMFGRKSGGQLNVI